MRDDALMYAITGEQPPPALAGTDEMAKASATVSDLRRGLVALGGELAAASPVAVPRARPVWTRPAVLAAAAGVVGVALAGGYALTMNDGPPDSSGSRSLPGVVACAQTIVVGAVTSVTPTGDRFAVTLSTERYLKPDDGPATFSATDAELPIGGAGGAPARGERALIVVHGPGEVDLFTGADVASEWAWMEKALPDSRSIDTRGCTGG